MRTKKRPHEKENRKSLDLEEFGLWETNEFSTSCMYWVAVFYSNEKKIKREMMMEEKIISCNFVRLLSLCFKFKATNKRN